MSAMVEKVAGGMILAAAKIERDVRLSELTSDEMAGLAHAAIAAMRNPPITILQAGAEVAGEMSLRTWTAMIDAALK